MTDLSDFWSDDSVDDQSYIPSNPESEKKNKNI